MTKTPTIMAHGDSWFDYPWFLRTGGGIPKHLSKLLGIPILNMARHGYGTEQMLSLRKRKELEGALPGTDILLFSGGGNDIAGDQFCIWLNDNVDGNIQKAICWERFDQALDLIVADYDDLVLICNEFAPDCLIVTHCYDFPPPSQFGRSIFFGLLGPWLQPSLAYCGWTNSTDQSKIVQMALERLNVRMVQWTALDSKRRIHIQTQGVLTPEDWGNEMHPNRSGFEKEAKAFYNKLQSYIYGNQKTNGKGL
jgi:hypothetical protein